MMNGLASAHGAARGPAPGALPSWDLVGDCRIRHLRGEPDGVELARVLRARFGIPFVFLTAHADQDTVRRASAALPEAYVLKPFTSEGLFAAIEVAMARKRIAPGAQSAEPAGPASHGSAAGLPAAKLKKVLAHLEDASPQAPSLTELAELAGLSPSHFARASRSRWGSLRRSS